MSTHETLNSSASLGGYEDPYEMELRTGPTEWLQGEGVANPSTDPGEPVVYTQEQVAQALADDEATPPGEPSWD